MVTEKFYNPQITRRGFLGAGAGAALALMLAGCSSSESGKSSKTSDKPYAGEEITVLLPSWYEEGITAGIPEFEEQTGITVKLEIMDWDALKDRIVTSCSSGTAPADITEFSWDWVSTFGASGWYEPLNNYFDNELWDDCVTKDSYKYGSDYLAMPIYNDFRMTYVNSKDFKDAGIDSVASDAFELLEQAKQIKEKGVEDYPISLPLSATAGATTPWFMLTKSLGGELLDDNYEPAFLESDSAGYKAMKWIFDAWDAGLINPAAVEYQGSDIVDHYMNGDGSIDIAGWSGNVTEYFNKEKSAIADDVEVIKVPGNGSETRTYSLLEGVGIPSTSEHKEAAAEFIKFINTDSFLKTFFTDYGIFPNSQKVIDELIESGDIPGGEIVSEVLGTIEPLFPQGAPEWYGTWEGETATIMNQMAKGELDLDGGLQKIADSAKELNKA